MDRGVLWATVCGVSESRTLLPAKILAFSTHQMKNTETEVGGNRKVAFILSWRRGKYSRLMPQELRSRSMKSLEAYIGKGSQSGVSDEEQKVIRPGFLPLSLFQRQS